MTIAALLHSDVDSLRADAVRTAAPRSEASLNDFAGNGFAPTGVSETLDTVVGLARQKFGADGVGILMTADGGAATTAASGARARHADALQVEHHEGPGFLAIKRRQPAVSPELRFDSRWRFWAPQAADLGLRSVLSLPLSDGDPFGAVNLYSGRRSFFGTDALAPGLAFAHQAAIAINVAVEREQLLQAAETRWIVGQAQGILMERYRITQDQAFALIRRCSTNLNQKVRLIAEQIISTQSLPDVGPTRLPRLLGTSSGPVRR